MNSQIGDIEMKAIQKFAEDNGQSIIDVKVDDQEFEMFARVDAKRLNLFPVAAYYHFFAHRYLPPEVTRVCYIDIDMVCDGNFYDWYTSDFEDNFFISSNSYAVHSFFAFNSGLFILNLEKLRTWVSGENFYLEKVSQVNFEKLDLIGDQEFIGYVFKEFKNNGFICKKETGLNFLLMHNNPIMLGLSDLPEYKVIHFNGKIKPWKYFFEEADLYKYIGSQHVFQSFDFSVVTPKLDQFIKLWWQHAVNAPFYDEIYQEALDNTKVLLGDSGKQIAENKKRYIQRAKALTNAPIILPQAVYNDYSFAFTNGLVKGRPFVEFKTQLHVNDQWIVFPLRKTLKKGDKLSISINCDYKTNDPIYLFLSDENLKTQHFPKINSKNYTGEIVANADGYGYLCLSSNSFKNKGDFIRFFNFDVK